MRTFFVLLLTIFLLALGMPSANAEAPRYYGVVGDSITAGVGTSNPATKAFPVVANLPGAGYSGRCITKSCYWHEPLVGDLATALNTLPARVNTIFLEMGVNDLNNGVSYAGVVRGMQAVRAEGSSLGVRVIFSTIVPPGQKHPEKVSDKAQRERVNRWIRTHGRFVEIAEPLSNSDGYLRWGFDSGDGLHPSDAGAAVMADALRDYIRLASQDLRR